MDLTDLHNEAITEFDDIQMAIRDERIQCLKDRRFYSIAGAQWEDSLGEQFANLPRFEINKIHQSVIRIINEYRNNRISVKFLPKKDGDDKKTGFVNGLYRADEQDSCAEEAKDNAFEEAVGGGFGAWRLRAVREDEYDDENDHQRIVFEPIFDADSCVFFDLDAKRQDKSDAKKCWVLSGYTYDGYVATFNRTPASVDKIVTQRFFDWAAADVYYVAEYYVVEEEKETRYYLRGLQGDEKTLSQAEYDDQQEELEATGYQLLRKREVKCRKVHKYIMDGISIIEDLGYLPGIWIPIVPKYGKRWYVDGVERCMGHVRLSKDAQRLKNMQMSRLGQIASLSPVEKPIFTPEQMAGHQLMWSEDDIQNYPYLLVNAIKDAQGNPMPTAALGYTKPPSLPPALAALLQVTETDMQDMLGNNAAMEKMPSNIAQETVEMIQGRLDMQAFIYIDNQAKAEKRCGEIWLSMAKEIYVEAGRTMKTVEEHGARGSVEIMKPKIDADTSEMFYENDLTADDFDVVTDVGASFSSRRQETVNKLTNLLTTIAQVDPQEASLISSAIMMNMEGEGLDDIREYYRNKLLQGGVIKPTEEEAQELAQMQQEAAQQPPDANTVYLQKAAEKEDALAKKAGADTVKSLAEAGKTRAETIEILHGEPDKEVSISQQAPSEQAEPSNDMMIKVLTGLTEALNRLGADRETILVKDDNGKAVSSISRAQVH